jgi:predicted NAD/FAD-binding protein
MPRKRIAIIGGGASGVALAWCLTSLPRLRQDWIVTLLHDEDELGGHSRTIPVWFDEQGRGHTGAAPVGRTVFPVDIGVQFVSRALHPNVYRVLESLEFRDRVRLHRHPGLRIAVAIDEAKAWGNFGEYRQRFPDRLDKSTWRLAREFERDLRAAPWRRVGNRRLWTLTARDYLAAAGIGENCEFVRQVLVPFLAVINGSATPYLLDVAMRDLFPFFGQLPFAPESGSCVSFFRPGRGMDRFAGGATSWINAMAGSAAAHGAMLRTSSRVKRVSPTRAGTVVEWDEPAFSGRGWAEFDAVVLTTEMSTSRELLDHSNNPHWTDQAPVLNPFRTHPTECYLHQDGSLLARAVSDGREDIHVAGSSGAPSTTYLMSNIVGAPHPCYLTRYPANDRTRRPDPAAVIAQRSWRRGWSATAPLDNSTRDLHRVQGAGGIYFAGTGTTVDSMEGALLSAMVIAHRVAGYPYPFPRHTHAHALYRRFTDAMFPA